MSSTQVKNPRQIVRLLRNLLLHYSSLPLDPLVHNFPPTVLLLLHQSQHLLVPIPPERMEVLRALVR